VGLIWSVGVKVTVFKFAHARIPDWFFRPKRRERAMWWLLASDLTLHRVVILPQPPAAELDAPCRSSSGALTCFLAQSLNLPITGGVVATSAQAHRQMCCGESLASWGFIRWRRTPYYQPTLLWTSLAVHVPAHGSYFHQDLLPRLPHPRKRLESRARQADENWPPLVPSGVISMGWLEGGWFKVIKRGAPTSGVPSRQVLGLPHPDPAQRSAERAGAASR